MGFSNPPIPWSEFERRLSGRAPSAPPGADGGDSPAWSARRGPYLPADDLVARATTTATATAAGPGTADLDRRRTGTGVPYAELHCHSNFSFLDGASHPEELAEEAVRLGLDALALTDHDGMYGIVRFAEAARTLGLPTVFGAELSIGLTGRQNGRADPEGRHLLVLARDPEGYRRLCATISAAQLAGGEKGRPVYDLDALADAHAGHWLVLTGCRKGDVPAAFAAGGPDAAGAALDALCTRFGHDNVAVELWDHGLPHDSDRNAALAALAGARRLAVVATNNVHYATPARFRLATTMAAVRARRSLDDLDGWLPAAPMACLRTGDEQQRRFARWPEAVPAAAAFGRDCAFELRLVAPRLPPFPVPDGETEVSWLRHLVEAGGTRHYGPRQHDPRSGPPSSTHPDTHPRAWAQLDHELDVIAALGFAGYFLIVWDIVEFCRRNDILCQGRGSAANSAVCYALGITAADAVRLGLLFERFLSPEREGPPDIDLDIESGRREEVIQYVFGRYGRTHAAQVANVITYRARSAVRDVGRALGHAPGRLDAWARQIDRRHDIGELAATTASDGHHDHDIPGDVLTLAAELEDSPRHLGIHSGGIVICDRPVAEVCPVEWATREGRSVLQWDKDDCATIGLVKIDLLGLGMLSALHGTLDLLREHSNLDHTLATIPAEDPATYDMLCEADTVGVFQIESRAQMATLPRLRPRRFYDLVVEVALIRPGPIQGGSVHPYIRRRNGREPVTYPHPLLEGALAKTLGVPLFQEQLMQMAIDVAGFSATDADQLRQAMGAKRSTRRMQQLKARLFAGMAERGVTGPVAEEIWDKLAAFANYGFPESHSVSFAYLVYASAWLKRHHPAAFCAALLNAQPMGFWSPQSLVADARRHGVDVRGPDVNLGSDVATLEGPPDAPVVRLGHGPIRHLGADAAAAIAAGRPYADLEDLARRVPLSVPQLEALATAGAFDSLGLERREALWAAGAMGQVRPDRLAGIVTGATAPTLPGMSEQELVVADLTTAGVSARRFATEFARDRLDALGVVPAAGLSGIDEGRRILVAGVVTHRQRPMTAKGVTFMNLEDETGLVNIVCSAGLWKRYRRIAMTAAAMVVRGRLERADGVVNIVADRLDELRLDAAPPARNFR